MYLFPMLQKSGGQGDEEPQELQDARRLALAACGDVVRKLIAIATSKPERGAVTQIMAARELIALAQGVRQGTMEAAHNHMRVLVIDPGKLDDVTLQRLRRAS